MTPIINRKLYKITLSFIFGFIGFFVNFHTIIFPFGEYYIAILLGLLFPLLITLSWGWKYGLLSAVFGGCQSMWWLWAPSNGYAVFLVVPPFTLWILWHGIFAALRAKQTSRKWWLNMYVVEIPFRILSSISLLTLSRWAISLNPPPWSWALNSATVISLNVSIFIVVKQACIAFILLLLADVLLSNRSIRLFFRLKQSEDYFKSSHVINIFLLLGCIFWLLDSFFHAFAFQEKKSFFDLFALDIPSQNIFTRSVFFIFCTISGLVTSKILDKQRKSELFLQKAKQEAVLREKFLKTLITAIPDLVWVKNDQGIYLACNARFEHFFGAKESDIVGKTDYDFVDRKLADFFREHDQKAMKMGIPQTNQEEIIFNDDGHRELLETTKTPMHDKNGQLIGMLGIGRNITERVNLQAQLAQAQRMESVGRLAGGVAHDYNNISSIIIGYSELALEKVKPADLLHDDLTEILTAAKRSTEITRQLLAFSRQQPIAPKILDLNNSIESMLKMLRRLIGEDINLSWSPESGVWPVKLDPTQVAQILVNLCVNARDAITDVGNITLETSNLILDEEYCADHLSFSPGKFVLLAVSDDGTGIAPEILDKIFEPFFTTKGMGQGTGLGLSTVYGIVKQNKGFVNVDSELNKGTVIKIYFPKETGHAVNEQSENSSQIPLGSGEMILLVEDDASILKLGTRLLEGLGYIVLSAVSPIQALSLAKEHAGNISLLITDVVMPEMNGRDLSKKLKAISPNLKVIFISGYTANVIADRGVLDDDVNFLSKPFSKKKMAFMIQKVLETTVT